MLSVSTESGMNVSSFRIANRKLTSLQKPQAEYADMPAFCGVESSLMWIMRDCSSRASHSPVVPDASALSVDR